MTWSYTVQKLLAFSVDFVRASVVDTSVADDWGSEEFVTKFVFFLEFEAIRRCSIDKGFTGFVESIDLIASEDRRSREGSAEAMFP